MWTPLKKIYSRISFLNQARWPRRPLWVISTVVVNNEFFPSRRSLPDLGLITESKVDERLQMFAHRHSNWLSSTPEQRQRISSALMIHFAPSAVLSRLWRVAPGGGVGGEAQVA